MCKQIEKKDSYTTLKNIKFREWKLVQNASQLLVSVSLKKPSQKQDITNFELVKKKIIEYQKHPKIIESLKESIKAIIITKYILDLEVNLTASKLLVFALIIKK